MNPDHGTFPEDPRVDLLALLDETLAAGVPLPAPGSGVSTPPQMRLEEDLAFLQMLNQLRPRHRSNMTPKSRAVFFGDSEAAIADPRVGTELGKYRIVGRLGKGGMGVVYEAEDSLLQRRVAIKLLPESVSSDPEALQRFLQEARAAARLNHPNVVAIYEVDQRDGTYYIVMEFVAGCSAQDLVKTEGFLFWREATQLIADVCRGLSAAHDAGLIHRDIKPGNIMVSHEATGKLADFGLAKATDAATALTTSGTVVGTPEYMSPEQCRIEPLDGRSDLYSLGATYYALLTGEPPFKAGSVVQIMFAHCDKQIPDLRDRIPDLPEACVAIVRQAMAKDPAQRFASAKEMLTALEAVLAKTVAPDISPTKTSVLTPRATADTSAPQRSAQGRDPTSVRIWSRATRPTSVVAGLVATLLVALFTYLHVGPSAWVRWVLPTDGPVWAVGCSRDGQFIAAANGHNGVRLWNHAATEPKVLANLWEGEKVQSLAFSADSKLLVAASNQGLRFWHADQAPPPTVAGVDESSEARIVAFSPTGKNLAVAFRGGDSVTIKVWDLNGKDQPAQPFRELPWDGPHFFAMSFSPDGTLLAAGGDHLVKVWSPGTGGLVIDLEVAGEVRCLAFCEYENSLYASTLTRCYVWDCFHWRENSWPSVDLNSIAAAGKLSASAYYNEIMFQHITRKQYFHREHQGEVYCIAFSADGRLMVSGSADQTVRLWDTSSFQK